MIRCDFLADGLTRESGTVVLETDEFQAKPVIAEVHFAEEAEYLRMRVLRSQNTVDWVVDPELTVHRGIWSIRFDPHPWKWLRFVVRATYRFARGTVCFREGDENAR